MQILVCSPQKFLSRSKRCCSMIRLLGEQEKFRWDRRYQKHSDTSGCKFNTLPLLGISFLVTLKDLLGIKKIILDEDPLKEKVRKAWMLRRNGQFEEAVDILHEALRISEDRKGDIALSRVYDELASTYYEMGSYKEAEELLRVLLSRLVRLHGKSDRSPEFIAVSLKLADILAQKGEITNAEIGYQHCTSVQSKVVEDHGKKYSMPNEGVASASIGRHYVEEHGSDYTDPIALFGMSLEQYAHFLVKYRDEERLKEATDFMDEAIRISHQIFGAINSHMINMLNNFGALLIMKNRFELARKFLEIGVERILFIDECSSLVPGYFCNYAECLFHCGEKEKALKYAEKALKLSNRESEDVKRYVDEFYRNLKKEVKGRSWFRS